MIFDGENIEEYELINKMLDIYGKLSGYKFRNSITAPKFVKLANYKNMTNQNVTKTDYDIIFKKIMWNKEN